MTAFPKIAYADSPNLDAFGRLRVSTPTTLLDVKLITGILASQWISAPVNGATVAATTPFYGATLSCTAASGSSAILQTKRHAIYQAGRSLQPAATFNFQIAGVGTANIRKRVGMFDVNDGVFLEQNGVDVRIVLRSGVSGSPVDTNAVVKANWNYDPFDGTGPSKITLDFTKTQIFACDLQYLGVGRVRCGFEVDGKFYLAHQFLNANNLTVPYMSNPNLPIRYECVQTATANTGTMLAICCCILSEGGFDETSRLVSQPTGVAGRTTIGAVRDEVIAIRLGANFVRKGMLLPEAISLLQTTQAFMWELVLNATPTGTVVAGSWVVPLDSIAEYNITRTATTGFTGGNVIASGLVSTAYDSTLVNFKSALTVAQLDLVPTSDILSLLVTTINTSDQTYIGSMSWRELQ